MKFQSEFIHFLSRKSTQKCRLENGGHFVSASMCWECSIITTLGMTLYSLMQNIHIIVKLSCLTKQRLVTPDPMQHEQEVCAYLVLHSRDTCNVNAKIYMNHDTHDVGSTWVADCPEKQGMSNRWPLLQNHYKSLLSNHAPIKGSIQSFKHATVCNRRENLKFGT